MKRVISAILIVMIVGLCSCQSAPSIVIAENPPASTASPSTETPPAPTPSAKPTATPQPTPTPTPAPIRVTLLTAGDLMCLSAQLGAAKTNGDYQFDYCFSEIKDIVSSVDLAIANLETLVAPNHAYTTPAPVALPTPIPAADESGTVITPIESTEQSNSGNTKINAPESFLSAVVGCGFDVLTNANNHIFDLKDSGIIQTLDMLDTYGMAHTGAYAAEQDKKPLVLDVRGIHIAVLAYTDILNNSTGNSLAYMVDTYDEERVAADIDAARTAGAEYVIVFMHWGTEHTHRVTRSQKAAAAHIAESGADIIIGSHPHCTQAIDLIETDRGAVPVSYSLGNLVSSMSGTIHNDGALLCMTIEKDPADGTTTLEKLSYISTLCTTTDAGRFVVLPATLDAIAQSEIASKLDACRQRTIDVFSDTIAVPE